MCALGTPTAKTALLVAALFERSILITQLAGADPLEPDLDGDTPLFCGPGNPPERCGFQQLGAGIRRQDLCATKLDKQKFSKEQLAKVIGEEEEG